MVNRTYNDPFNWRNIGFYLDKYMMVLNMDLIRVLKSASRVFKLYKGISHPHGFISNELMELSQINLSSTIWSNKYLDDVIKGKLKADAKKEEDLKSNIPYDEEVYFDELLSNALKCYSGSPYKCINGYLRKGFEFVNSVEFKTKLY